MYHITLSGYHAGEIICGAERNTEDQYTHLNITHINNERHKYCPDCLKMYDESIEDDNTKEWYDL